MKEKETKATEQVCEECNQLPINCECESVIGTRWHDTKPEATEQKETMKDVKNHV